jgi:predicted SAM-dependent methyltransferase
MSNFIVRNCLQDPQTKGVYVSVEDKEIYMEMRNFIEIQLQTAIQTYVTPNAIVLEIGPENVSPKFHTNVTHHTMDIVKTSDALTFVGDITKTNEMIISEVYDIVMCCEVLEHTNQPFDALKEMYRITKPGGYVFLSTPCNFRIHNPLPDNWRFTEHGLKALAHSNGFTVVSMAALQMKTRPLFPIDYFTVLKK